MIYVAWHYRLRCILLLQFIRLLLDMYVCTCRPHITDTHALLPNRYGPICNCQSNPNVLIEECSQTAIFRISWQLFCHNAGRMKVKIIMMMMMMMMMLMTTITMVIMMMMMMMMMSMSMIVMDMVIFVRLYMYLYRRILAVIWYTYQNAWTFLPHTLNITVTFPFHKVKAAIELDKITE